MAENISAEKVLNVVIKLFDNKPGQKLFMELREDR